MRCSGLVLSPVLGKLGNLQDLPPAELMCQSPVSFVFSSGKEFLARQNGNIKKPAFRDFLKKRGSGKSLVAEGFVLRFGPGLFRGPIVALLLFWG